MPGVTRQTLGIAFEGYTEPQIGLLCDAGSRQYRPASIYLNWHSGGTVALFPVERCLARLRHAGYRYRRPSNHITEMQTQLVGMARWLAAIHAAWLSMFRVNERLAAKYKCRSLLPGGRRAYP